MKNVFFYFGISFPVYEVFKFLLKNWWRYKLYTAEINHKIDDISKILDGCYWNLAVIIYVK